LECHAQKIQDAGFPCGPDRNGEEEDTSFTLSSQLEGERGKGRGTLQCGVERHSPRPVQGQEKLLLRPKRKIWAVGPVFTALEKTERGEHNDNKVLGAVSSST